MNPRCTTGNAAVAAAVAVNVSSTFAVMLPLLLLAWQPRIARVSALCIQNRIFYETGLWENIKIAIYIANPLHRHHRRVCFRFTPR